MTDLPDTHNRGSKLDALSFAIYDWGTLLSSTVVALVNGMSWPLAGIFVLFGLIVDFNRFTSSNFPEGLKYSLGRFRFPVYFYARPVWTLYLFVGTIGGLTVLYLAFPDTCWPALNQWIEANIAIVGWRMSNYSPVCHVPHGFVIVLAQAVMTPVIVFIVAMLVTSARFNPKRYRAEAPNFFKLHKGSTRKPSIKKTALMGNFIVFWLAYSAASALWFEPDSAQIVHAPKPQHVVWFVTWLLLWSSHVFFINPIVEWRIILGNGDRPKDNSSRV